MEDIAVVGVGLRFPGDAASPEKLWEVLEQGTSQWSEFPKDRLNIDGYYHPGGDRQGSISFRGAHFLNGDIAAFDAPFFSIAAEDAKAIDPQQRYLLEVCYEALENAGLRKEDIDGTDTSVYVGSFVKDYEQICLRDPDWQPQYAATGNGIAIMANRISYFFNLHGPSMTIDTGCSGSLVSIHLAAQSLRAGESSLAIAAGAGMILTPNTIMPMTALNFLSPDGKCFTFDSRANGYGRGEGIGVVILKRLSDAIRDNDTIRAVIRGTNVNQDGRTTGITLPSKEAQVANIRSVYAGAGLDFNQTAYVECHGTGTQAGDWRELKAISETLGSSREAGNPVFVGSVKPNIGHLEGAAGVAGLIKAVLVLERGKIPPNINFENGHPGIQFEDWNVKVPREVLEWPIPGIRRVSVNCFGFGGTNAHVIMDEAPVYLSSRGLKGNHSSSEVRQMASKEEPAASVENQAAEDRSKRSQIFCYSAHERSGVERIMSSHSHFLTSQGDNQSDAWLQDYAYTLGCRRSVFEWKGFIVANSATDLAAKMERMDKTAFTRTSKQRQSRVCFVFSGQGSQWAQMGKDLMSFDVFRNSVEEASSYMKTVLESRFDLMTEISKDASQSRIGDPEISQPATTALQLALVQLLDSFGVYPQHSVGHSSGEIAAAFASGAITRQAAWEIAYYRGLAAASISIRAPKLRGGMMVVGMSLRETEDYLQSAGKSAQVACVNSPRSITISGRVNAIESIAEDMRQKKIFCHVLAVKTAYHSSHMKLVEHDYKDSLAGIIPRDGPSSVKMFSSVTGERVNGSQLDGEYWARNMVSPVQYVAAVQSMMSQPANERPSMIIELSPRAALRSPTQDILAEMELDSQPTYSWVLSPKVEGTESLLNVVGELWSQGSPLDLKTIVSRGSSQTSIKSLSDLPPYPWNHTKSYWHESHLGETNRFREYPRLDLIGAPTADSISFEPRWRGFLRISENPWIQDHQVQKTVIYPAAGMVSMVLEGARQLTKETIDLHGYEITDMQIEKAMIIPSTAHGLEVALNMRMEPESEGYDAKTESRSFSIYSKALNRSWERHATGTLRIRRKVGNWEATFAQYQQRHQQLQSVCTEALVPRQLYEFLDTIGMNYGSLFQNITEISKGGDSCVSIVRVPDTQSKMPAKFEYPHAIHPTTLDSMFQTLLAIEPVSMVPTFIKSIFVSGNITGGGSSQFAGYSTATRTGIKDADATIVMKQTDAADSYVVINGLHLSTISSSSPESCSFLPNHRNLCTEIVWKEDAAYASPNCFREQVDVLAHKYPDLAVLQVGGGFALAKAALLTLAPDQEQTPRLSRYTIIGLPDSETARETFSFVKDTNLGPFVETTADVSSLFADYHMVIIGGEAYADLEPLKKHLKVDGVILQQNAKPGAMLPPNIDSNNGDEVGHSADDSESGTSFVEIGSRGEASIDSGVLFDSDAGEVKPFMKVHLNHRTPVKRASPLNVVLLLPAESGNEVTAFTDGIKRLTEQSQDQFCVSSMLAGDVLENDGLLPGSVVISMLDFAGVEARNSSVFDWDEAGFDVFHALQKTTKGIIWITRGAHMKPLNPKGSPIVALARTLMSEDPLKQIMTLDLGMGSHLGDDGVLQNVLAVFNNNFCMKPGSGPQEMEYAEEAGKLYIPRLAPVQSLNQLIEDEVCSGTFVQQPFSIAHSSRSERRGLKLTISKPGLTADGLYFAEFDRPELGANEVQIAVVEAPLTSLDVETAMGQTVDSMIGTDVRGHVVRVGSNVTKFQPDDEVVALVPNGALQDAVHVEAQFVHAHQDGMAPSFFVSAYYALVHAGRAGPGRKVLVHAGASPFGLAAVEVARAVGAEVFATVLGFNSAQQRELLERRGLQSSQILDADSDTFVEDIRAATGGRGVDVLYNPTQEHIEANFKCVRKCGTIVQFANKSPSAKTVRTRADSVTIVNFDLRQLLAEEPEFVADMLEHATQLIRGRSSPLPTLVEEEIKFGIGKLEDAMRYIQQAPYLGYVSVSADLPGRGEVSVFNDNPTKPLHEAIDGEGTYLLAGGLGGLGRSISELLISNGAKHLAYLSRSGASSEQAKTFIDSLLGRGIDARVYCVDICDDAALKNLIEDRVTVEMPLIAGVFQCAAVIKDAVFENMTYPDWAAAFRPKTSGSWNLVQSIPAAGHSPFFVFLASSTGVIGNRGQANYAAGNFFEDCLARYCRLQGRHAVSIDLGPVLGAGMLAEDEEILDMLRASGFYGIRHEDFLRVVKHAITGETFPGTPTPAQVILGVGTGGIIRQNEPADPYWARTSLYTYLNLIDMPRPDLTLAAGASNSVDVKTRLASCASAAEATEMVCIGLSNMLAKAMNMLPEEVDVGKPPNAYGVDSLVAVGVRNWVLSNCGVQVSVFEVLSDKTVAELSGVIAEKGGFGGEMG